eukprot:15443633-Alexandrium_andersonii.AAC.1
MDHLHLYHRCLITSRFSLQQPLRCCACLPHSSASPRSLASSRMSFAAERAFNKIAERKAASSGTPTPKGPPACFAPAAGTSTPPTGTSTKTVTVNGQVFK